MDAAWCGVEWGSALSTSPPVTAPAARDHVPVPRASAAPGSRSDGAITSSPPSTKSEYYVSPFAGLAGYWEQSDNSQHVNFVALGVGNVHELIFRQGATCWQDTDLTANAQGTPAFASSGLDSYWDASDDSQHVHFVDGNGHVHELFFKSGATNWVDNDLTALSGGPLTPLGGPPSNPFVPPAQGPRVPISGYLQVPDQSQHVDFLDNNGDIQELSFHPEFSY